MAETLDMTLDDIIKNNKKSNPSSDGVGCRCEGHHGSAVGDDRGSSRGIGPTRHAFKRSGNRVVPYQPLKAPDSVWQHDMYSEVIVLSSSDGKRVSAIEADTKLYISNVDFGVSIEDIKELFSELGDLKRSSIHYDRSGRSKGTAEVVFARRGDAVAAVKKYNNVQLDGKPMKIEILGTNIPTCASALPANVKSAPRSAQRGGPAGLLQSRPRPRGGRGRGGSSGGGGPGGRRGKERSQPKSAEELDADLEKYHADAMQTN